jgi:hypothetical protein
MQDRLHRILQAVEIGLGEMTRKMKMRYPNLLLYGKLIVRRG